MKIMNKKYFIGILGILVLVIACYSVSAIAVAFRYSYEKPMEIYPGETQEIMVGLQNPEFEEGIVLKGSLLAGSEVASLEEGPFTVPYGGETLSKMTIRIPSNAAIGQEYEVRYEFVQQVSESTGMITMGQTISTGFKIKVVERPPEPEEIPEPKEEGGTGWIVLIAVLVLVIIVVVYLIYKSKRAVKSSKK